MTPEQGPSGGPEATRTVYDAWGKDYDEYLPYEEKYEREAEIYAEMFRRYGARRILDAGCGTGRHAIRFARRGFQVVGSDLSPGMLDTARRNAQAAGVDIPLVTAAFEELAQRVEGPFDAVLVTGGGVSHLVDDDQLQRGLENFARILRPGGILITDNHNFEAYPERECLRIGPLEVNRRETGDKLWLRILDFRGPVVHYHVVTAEEADGRWAWRVKDFFLRADTRSKLHELLPRSGFRVVEDHSDFPFQLPGFDEQHQAIRHVLVAQREA